MYKIDIETLNRIKEALSNSLNIIGMEMDFMDSEDDGYKGCLKQVKENSELVKLIEDNFYV